MGDGATVERVQRDIIIGIRAEVLGSVDAGVSTMSGDLSPATRHWVALWGGEPVGCVSVMRLRGWALRGLAVLPHFQRRGIGGCLTAAACAAVDAPMWCNARVAAVPFYSHRGWVEQGPLFDIAGHGLHQRMTWSPSEQARVQ